MEANVQVLQVKQDKKCPNYLYTLGEIVLVILNLDNYV